jgi:hypothetical protein
MYMPTGYKAETQAPLPAEFIKRNTVQQIKSLPS